jgi:hypothetical protein
MVIRAVTRPEFEEFDRFGAPRLTLNDPTRRAVEWFVDDTGVLLGSIACSETSLEWSFMILRRDSHGRFHAIHLETGCRDVDHARRLLFKKMESALVPRDR